MNGLEATAPRKPGGFKRAGALAVVLSGPLLMGMMFTVLLPVLSAIGIHFQARGGAFVSQMIMSTPGFGMIVGGLLGGLVLERIGVRAGLMGALALYALAGLGGLVIDDPWLFLIARLVLGLSAAVAQTAMVILVSRMFDEEGRAKLLGYSTAVGFGGSIITMLAAGMIGELGGWRATNWLYLIPLVTLLIAMVCLPPERRSATTADPAPAKVGFIVLARLWPVYLLIFAFYALYYMLAIQLSFLLADNAITSPAVQSWIMTSVQISGVIGAFGSGWLLTRLGTGRVFALMAVLMGVGYLAIGLSHGALLTVVGCAISGFGAGVMVPALINLVVDRCGETARLRAVGLVYTVAYLGEFLNPVLLNPLRVLAGIHAVYVWIGPLLVLSGLLAGVLGLKAARSRAVT